MQDGAPPHWSTPVRDWLNEKFPHRWIGRGGAHDTNIAWPPRSPDLTPMDYFVWGFIKSNVYVKNYHSLDDLKNSINAAFQKITEVMISSTLENFVRRLNFVVERSGGHIENI